MKLPKIVNIAVLTESIEVYNWLASSLALTSLSSSRLYRLEVVNELDNLKFPFVIVTEEKFKPLSSYLNKHSKSVPILVLTKEFNSFSPTKLNKVVIDTLPLQAATINLLEHLIKSILQDFKLNQQLTLLAHYDPLTGAANRLLFRDRLDEALKQAKRNKNPVSVLSFDLDDFKPVNDTYGHDVGDELLKRFVMLITAQCRSTDTIARLGGDEFILLLPNTPFCELDKICQKIVGCLKFKQTIKGNEIEIKSSIGAASISGEAKAMSAEGLLKSADEAVYLAKKKVGTSYVFA